MKLLCVTAMNTDDVEIILGNSNKRFSGVTSTMLQVLKYQQERVAVAVLGKHNMPDSVQTLNFFNFIRICRKPLRDGRYRTFHARRNDEMIQGLIAKRVFGAKIKIAFTSTAQRNHSRFSRWLMRQMDGLITTCSAASNYLVERAPDIIIPHGVDTSHYVPASSRELAWKQTGFPGRYGIGVFGRVRYTKGIDILVKAVIPLLSKYPDLTVVICGECIPKDRSFLQQLRSDIDQADVSELFIFLGKQPFVELPRLFQSMSLVTALSREEGFGLTPLEAMAAGTAVVTSEAGAWRDIIRNGIDGYCISIANIEDVTATLDAMLGDLELTHEMGRNARDYVVEQYTVEREAELLTHFLKSLSILHN